MKKIGVLGGTFSPVHAEHVAIALSAVEGLALDKIIIMPTFITPNKENATAPVEDRLNMLRLAFKGVEKAEISDYEITKGGKSFTYQTVEHFKELYPDAELYFLVGGDMLENFKTWRYPERILSACTLVACGRDGADVDFDKEQEYFISHFGKEFIKLSYRGKKCSSTKIRVYAMLGLDVTAECGKEVADYIKGKGLFGGGKQAEFVKRNLTEKRLRHTANVIVTALQKAKETGISENKIILTAMLHDCAKYLNPNDYPAFTLPDGVPAPVVHAYLGAFVAENVLGVTDEEVIDAIRYHTSGKAKMTTLAKLIFVADMIEEGRDYNGVDELRKAYEKGVDHCFRECLKEETEHLKNKKVPIYVETLNAYDYYVNGNDGE